MGIARYKDLCIDTGDGARVGRFWANALGLEYAADDDPRLAGTLSGPGPAHRIWLNVVPEPKTVKHRVHLDIHTASIAELVGWGAAVLEPAEEFGRAWTVLADPDGGEFCAFVRAPDRLPAYRFYELVIDAAEPEPIARWWADVFGCGTEPGNDEASWWWLDGVPDLPYDGWAFIAVPEPKTAKNRVHFDVTVESAESVEELVAAGATVLRRPDDEIFWTVMADPIGNEFCAFVAEQ